MTVEQIREKLKDLKTESDVIKLHGVYPNLIQEAIGEFDNSTYDINGWECDYWVKTDKYKVFWKHVLWNRHNIFKVKNRYYGFIKL